jgi:FkbM family methyltransferase
MIKRLISLAKPVITKFPLVTAVYRNTRDQIGFMAEPTLTPWGFKLGGNVAMEQGTFEPIETAIIRNMLKDVDVVVNVGANIGYYCCHALSMGKKVIAFEPIDRNLRYLYKNLKANNYSGTEIFPIALSNSIGVLEIYGGNTGASVVKGWAGIQEEYVTLVPSSTMDIVLGDRLKGKKVLVIVDIEGAEKWMLEGATKMLSSDPKPIWLVEVNSTEHQPQNVSINPNFKSTFQIFFDNDYQAFKADRDMTRVTNESIELVLTGDIEMDTHNFIFSPSIAKNYFTDSPSEY